MKLDDSILQSDDFELSLREAKSQRIIALMSLEVSNAVIAHCRMRIKGFPVKKVK